MPIKTFLQRNLLGPWRSGATLATLRWLPRFLRDWNTYRGMGGEQAHIFDWFLQVHDATASTQFDPHYFHQSAWAARKISSARPLCHLDVGSQIDLIAPLSAFVPVEFVDLRPLRIAIPGLQCVKGSILALPCRNSSVISLSSLHVVEHVGLGRYGDPVDPAGYAKACAELQRVLARGGNLYITVPVGRPRVDFNAHRVFAPDHIPAIMPQLRLVEFSAVDDGGTFHPDIRPADVSSSEYALGLYHLARP